MLFGAVIRSQHQAELLLGIVKVDPARDLCDGSDTLRCTRLEELLDTGQTLGDVICRSDTAGVEGTHRQLCTGLTDGLRGDDAHSLADVHGLTRGQ